MEAPLIHLSIQNRALRPLIQIQTEIEALDIAATQYPPTLLVRSTKFNNHQLCVAKQCIRIPRPPRYAGRWYTRSAMRGGSSGHQWSFQCLFTIPGASDQGSQRAYRCTEVSSRRWNQKTLSLEASHQFGSVRSTTSHPHYEAFWELDDVGECRWHRPLVTREPEDDALWYLPFLASQTASWPAAQCHGQPPRRKLAYRQHIN